MFARNSPLVVFCQKNSFKYQDGLLAQIGENLELLTILAKISLHTQAQPKLCFLYICFIYLNSVNFPVSVFKEIFNKKYFLNHSS